MSYKKILALTSTILIIFALVTTIVSAVIGNQNPNLKVELNVNPTIVKAGDSVTIYTAITNNLNKPDKVVSELEVQSPSGVLQSYYKTYYIGTGQKVSASVVYIFPSNMEKGVYTVTLSATDKQGASWATEYVTVQ